MPEITILTICPLVQIPKKAALPLESHHGTLFLLLSGELHPSLDQLRIISYETDQAGLEALFRVRLWR